MINKEKEQLRTFVKLGFSHLETTEIITALNILLANYQIHHQKLRSFHWNVEGQHFFELHETFDTFASEVSEHTDTIAERIRVFGKRPLSTLREYLEIAEISEINESITSFQMVKEILDDFEKLLSFILDVTEAASRIGDNGTMDLMTTFTGTLEKHHWMLSAWIKNEKPY